MPSVSFIIRSSVAALGMVLASWSQTLACGGPFDIGCNIGKAIEKGAHDTGKTIEKAAHDTGHTLEKAGQDVGQVGRDIDRWRLEFLASVFSGPALEQWIIQSRNDALNGAQPVPPNVRQALVSQGWTTDALINKVRYKIGDGGAFNLAHDAISYGDAAAITLIDVIVFRGPADANDMAIWAHEMQHVAQYDEWGVHSFAVQYMRSWKSVENPAYAIENEYRQTGGIKSGGSTSDAVSDPTLTAPDATRYPPPPPPPVYANGAPKCFIGPQPVNFCFLQPGNYPLGAPCGCPTPAGTLPGRTGY